MPKSAKMSKRENEPFDLEKVKQSKLKERQTKWDDFFTRYEKLDGFGEDVDMSTLTDQENTTDESDSECDSQEDDVQEDNNDDSDDNSEGSSDCIELLSEDEGEFAKTFKQYCEERIETLERMHEDHWSEETKNENGHNTTVRRSTIHKEVGTRKITTGVPSRKRSSSNALPYFNKCPAITNNNDGNSLALVKSTSNTNDNPPGGQILRMEDVRTFNKNGFAYIEETITTTVTKRVMVTSDGTSNPTIDAALKGLSDTPRITELPSMPSMPPMPSANQSNVSTSTFSYDIDDDPLAPKTPRFQHIQNATSTFSSTRKIQPVQQISISTPKTPKPSTRAKNNLKIEGDELTKHLPKVRRSIKENLKTRSIELKSNEQVSLLNRPKVNTKPNDDPLFKFVVTPKASIIKNVDLEKPKKALKFHHSEE